MQYCVKNTIKPVTICTGSKLMELKIAHLNLRIIDSHNFVPSPLSAFPETFGLDELKKGYFPHLFNTKENENYMGPMPPILSYLPNKMKDGPRETFIKWYKQKWAENYQFDMKKELYEYCSSDVDILRRGCLSLRQTFLDIANIDLFSEYITIASVCMAIYRSRYLDPESIAIVLKEIRDQFSKVSIGWLESFNNDNIAHATNGGEVQICGAKVDGFDSTTNTVYQFHGCFWHGCPECFDDDTINHVTNERMTDLYQKTMGRTEQLEEAGYTVVEMWECAWKKSREFRQNRANNNDQIIDLLNPRDAFFGGRTEAFKLHKTVDGNMEKIKYVDVCSLYPTVMYYDDYPIGHPEKIINPPSFDPDWYGFIKCKVVAPKDLYIPTLPVRVKMEKSDKLLFPLCLKCAKDKQRQCTHSDSERAFVGTWCTPEVNKAIEVGYKVLEVYEVWNFEKDNCLWKGYIKDFLKMKLESSEHSYPTKEAYAEAVKRDQGIELDQNKIAYNPGRRAVSKLCLNSLWGKFGQRDNLGVTEFITDPCKFYDILLNDRLTNIQVNILSDDMIQVNYKYKDVFVEDNFNTNIYVAAFTTANARLRLYDLLHKLDQAVLYCDTDSIVYVDNGRNTVPTGDLLGQWTDELKGAYITKFLSTGPKSYHYITSKGKQVIKVKGFTLHHKNAKLISGESMEKLLFGEIKEI
ncbi:uncharacterized protein LOC135846916 [Planococcus citri]|uniref:uncharacterized protein LOC135846916 n=1 Tax=Planococcus citri TaxID=170843 RepID=UPI0031F9A153